LHQQILGSRITKSIIIYLLQIKKVMKTTELKQGYSIFGNKGNVWSNTAHIYKNGEGNLCGTPALSNNWARIEQMEHVGCPECLEKYKAEN
jgi:hypothetical protein